MKPELLQKWTHALESRAYKQGKKRLRNNDNEFCCLGVLREIVQPGSTESNDDGGGLLSPSQCEQFGIRDDFQRALANANDGSSTFMDIAAILRAVPPECM